MPVYSGTDSGTVLPHGRIAEEAELLARLGGVEFALEAVGWNARRWLVPMCWCRVPRPIQWSTTPTHVSTSRCCTIPAPSCCAGVRSRS